ncbi:MAG: TolC family outer membrane protein [Alphaproteobacteria bacterium]|nr:TolC family outer membrane protein [Alphaproteobacteria bacterium]
MLLMNMQQNKNFTFLTLLISSTFLCDPIFGESCQPALIAEESQAPVSLQETLEHAYMQNADLDAARADLRVTDENVSQAIADWRPSLSVEGTQTQSQRYPIGKGKGAHGSTTEYTASISQNIYKGGATVANIGKTESDVLAGKANLFSVEQRTLLDGVTNHTEILKDIDIVNYRKKSVEFYKKNLDRTQARYEVGEGSRTDVEASRADYEGAKAQLSRDLGALETAKAVYLHQIGSPPGKLAAASVISDLPETVAEALEISKIYSPIIMQAKYTLEAAQYNVDLQMAGLLPVAGVEASVGNDRRGGTNNQTHPRNTNFEFGAKVTVPLYAQGIPNSQVRQAYQQVAQRKVQLVNAQRQVVENVQTAWDTLVAARVSLVGFLAQVKAQELAVEGAFEEVNVGTKTVIDVLELEERLIEAQVELAQAQQTLITASYGLLAAMGRLTARDLKLNVKYYDPDKYYNEYKNAWIQFWQGKDLRYVRDGDEDQK